VKATLAWPNVGPRLVLDAVSRLFVCIVFGLAILACTVPFLIMVINATHAAADLTTNIYLLPGRSLVENYNRLIQRTYVWGGFLNSWLISIPVTVGSVYLGSLTGYGFSRFRFKYKDVLFFAVLATIMIPEQAGLIGLYQFVRNLHLLDTYWGIIIPGIVNPHSVFWMRMYVDSAIPDALMESARIEGCREYTIFNRIVFPLLKPAVATIAIFNFVQIWNNYIIPLILITSKKKYPLPVQIAQLRDVWAQDNGAMYVGITISVVPIIAAFMFFSKKIIGGLMLGSTKG
jgi:multiple sugar transport system permease protein